MEAQRLAVQAFLNMTGMVLVNEFGEVGSAADNHRIALQEALAACVQENAVLVTAKIDRLSRSMVFLATLIESGVPFRVVDIPPENEFMMYVMGAFGEYERKLNSARTTAALKVAKDKGVELGKHGRQVLAEQNRNAADLFALSMAPVIEKIQQDHDTLSIRALAKELNKRRKRSFRKQKWHPNTVQRLLKRIEELTGKKFNHHQ